MSGLIWKKSPGQDGIFQKEIIEEYFYNPLKPTSKNKNNEERDEKRRSKVHRKYFEEEQKKRDFHMFFHGMKHQHQSDCHWLNMTAAMHYGLYGQYPAMQQPEEKAMGKKSPKSWDNLKSNLISTSYEAPTLFQPKDTDKATPNSDKLKPNTGNALPTTNVQSSLKPQPERSGDQTTSSEIRTKPQDVKQASTSHNILFSEQTSTNTSVETGRILQPEQIGPNQNLSESQQNSQAESIIAPNSNPKDTLQQTSDNQIIQSKKILQPQQSQTRQTLQSERTTSTHLKTSTKPKKISQQNQATPLLYQNQTFIPHQQWHQYQQQPQTHHLQPFWYQHPQYHQYYQQNEHYCQNYQKYYQQQYQQQYQEYQQQCQEYYQQQYQQQYYQYAQQTPYTSWFMPYQPSYSQSHSTTLQQQSPSSHQTSLLQAPMSPTPSQSSPTSAPHQSTLYQTSSLSHQQPLSPFYNQQPTIRQQTIPESSTSPPLLGSPNYVQIPPNSSTHIASTAPEFPPSSQSLPFDFHPTSQDSSLCMAPSPSSSSSSSFSPSYVFTAEKSSLQSPSLPTLKQPSLMSATSCSNLPCLPTASVPSLQSLSPSFPATASLSSSLSVTNFSSLSTSKLATVLSTTSCSDVPSILELSSSTLQSQSLSSPSPVGDALACLKDNFADSCRSGDVLTYPKLDFADVCRSNEDLV